MLFRTNKNNKSKDLKDEKIIDEDSKINISLKEVNKFIDSEKELLDSTIKQQNRVNNQHNDLLQLTDKIKNHMSVVSELTNKANVATSDLYSEGNKLLNITENTLKMSMDGKNEIESMAEIIKVLENENIKSKEMINSLANKFTKVNDVVNLISNIANQINLLSLNASIEAARAGEHGKGFSIVAGEVGKLADQTKHNIKDISDLINNISNETKDVIDNSEKSNEIITKGVSTSIQAIDKIELSLSSVSNVDIEVKKVIEILNNQSKYISDVNKEILNVDNILKVNAKAVNNHIKEASTIDKQLDDIGNSIDKFRKNNIDKL